MSEADDEEDVVVDADDGDTFLVLLLNLRNVLLVNFDIVVAVVMFYASVGILALVFARLLSAVRSFIL